MVRVKYIVVLLSILLSYNVPAQTQQGIVKTRGRMVNGQLVAGTRLSGATITLNFGNSLVSGSQGGFSFNVPSGKAYSLVMAEKKGYTLADPEYTRRSFKYSASNPFYVVLEDEAQRQADINAATRKVRRTLTAQLQAREDEIEALKEQNKLTEEEYQKRLQELYDNQSKSEQLVKEMAEHYASTDYDQLDEFNRQVQMYIEKGELQKADSMIRSKGDIEKRVEEYHNVVAANQKTRDQLEQSEAGAAKTYEDLSQDLLHRSEIFLQTFQHDSALYCLKLRADLDTTKVSVVWSYAQFCYEQKKFSDCEKYYLICLRAFINQNDITNIASVQNNLGLLYRDFQNFANSEYYFKLALENFWQLFQQEPDVNRVHLAMTQNNLGYLYNDLRDYPKSEKYSKSALENFEQLFRQNPDAYRANIAGAQNNLGNLYYSLHDFANSEKYFKLTLENVEHLFHQNPDAYRENLAKVQSNLSNLYTSFQDYPSSEKYLKLALVNFEQLFRQNPDAYRELLAGTQNNLGILYNYLHDYTNSEKYFKLSLESKEQLFLQNPDAYRADLATTQDNLGLLYCDLHDYANSEKYHKLALENRENLFQQNPDAYRVDLTMTQNSLGILYRHLHDYTNSEKYHKLALENKKLMFHQNPDAYRATLATTYWNMMLLYGDVMNLEQYDQYLESSLKLFNELHSIQSDIYNNNVIELQNRKVWRLLAKGKVDEALTLAQETLSMNESDEITKNYLAECYNCKAFEYSKDSDYSNAHKSIDKAISMRPDNVNFYNSKGEILLMQGKNDEALKMWKKVLELNPDFLKGYPDGTDLSNGLKKLGLIE